MSDIIESHRRAFTINLAGEPCRMAVQAFCPSHHSFVIHVDPAKLLAGTEHAIGLKRQPIGEGLHRFRLNKRLAESMEHPFEMPSAHYHPSASESHEETFKLWDAPLVRFLLEQGAHEIPVLVGTANEEELESAARKFGSDRPVKSAEELGFDIKIDGAEPLPANDDDFTLFMTIDDLEASIDAHIRQLDFHETTEREVYGSDQNFYKNFTSTTALLDAMIAMGLSGAHVKKGWDGLSMFEGMQAAIEARSDELEQRPEDIEPMELIDRFARLYERYLQYCDKPEFNKVIDLSDEQRIQTMCRDIAHKISCNLDAEALARTELCFGAQELLFTSMGRNSATFIPDRSAAPKAQFV